MQPIAIRPATASDRPVLDRLAGLDSARMPSGEVLIATVGDTPAAAIEVASGRTVADPFQPTATVVELLRLRADGRDRQATAAPRRLQLAPRFG